MVHALALPIESATSWLRMNDEDILRETQSFILKALDQFGVEFDLPAKSKTKMLAFINEQMAIKDAAARHTLLSLDELADLNKYVSIPAPASSRLATRTRTRTPLAPLPMSKQPSRSPHSSATSSRRVDDVASGTVKASPHQQPLPHDRRKKATIRTGGPASVTLVCSAKARSGAGTS